MLLTKTNDQFWVVRLHVVRALGLIKDPVAIDTLKARLGDNKWQVRTAAATALATIGSAAYLVLVERYLRSNDQYTREQVKEELASSGVIDSFVDFIVKNRDRLNTNGKGESNHPKPLINGGTIPPSVYMEIADLLITSGADVPAEIITNMTNKGMGNRERSLAIEILRTLKNRTGHQPIYSH